MTFLQFVRLCVKRISEKKFLVNKFLSLGGGDLQAKKARSQLLKKYLQHDILANHTSLSQNKF